MAKIKLGIGMSHTPRLVSEPADWLHFGSFAGSMGGFLDMDGSWISGPDLIKKYSDQFADQAKLEVWQERYDLAQQSIARLAQAVKDADIDVMIVLGDDQHELFTRGNYPSVFVYSGTSFKMVDSKARAARRGHHGMPEIVRGKIAQGWYMDANHLYPNHKPLAQAIIREMLIAGITPAVADDNPADPSYGMGHAVGIVITKLLQQEKTIPLVPILLNTYFPPNQPTPTICWQVGQAIKRAVAALPDDLNVGVLASGGVSHFVVNEKWDREILNLLREGDEAKLMQVPVPMLQSGNSEMLNWIAMVSACQHLSAQWDVYTPIYSQPFGEGVGLAFAEWR